MRIDDRPAVRVKVVSEYQQVPEERAKVEGWIGLFFIILCILGEMGVF